MKLNLFYKLLLTAGVLYFSSCGKKTTIKGVVISPKGVPMPNQVVHLPVYIKNSETANSEATAALTDADGRFELHFRLKKKRSYNIEVFSADSGYYKSEKFTQGPGKEIVINLKQ